LAVDLEKYKGVEKMSHFFNGFFIGGTLGIVGGCVLGVTLVVWDEMRYPDRMSKRAKQYAVDLQIKQCTDSKEKAKKDEGDYLWRRVGSVKNIRVI
jgi:hypothetical protein